MRKLTLLLIFCALVITSKAQLAVTAPVLEQLSTASLKNQITSTESSIQSKVNTLNTAKNTLDNVEKLKEIDKRLTEVNEKLKQVQKVSDIFQMGKEMLQQVNEATSYINRYSKVNPAAARRQVDLLQGSVNKVEEMILMCKKILSNDFAMNDYERIKLLDDYKDKIGSSINSASQAKKKFSFIVGINGF